MSPSPSSPAGVLAGLSSDLADAVEAAGRSVVAIHARRRIPASGVVWQPGVVVAANHTIARDDDITLTDAAGTSHRATLAGRDAGTDLAVLRVEGANGALPAAPTASAAPRVGQLVLAIGRPGPSVTASLGIVSAVGGEWRTWQGGLVDRFVRLDVAIYDGFSGGPLVAATGEVLGVNTSGLARAAAIAVPAATVTRVADQLLTSGRIARGYLGIATQPVRIPEELRQRLRLPAGVGLVIVNVEAESPAGRGGLLLGDVIVALDERPVADPTDVLAAVAADRVGRPVTVGVVRGGEARTVSVTVGERPSRGRR